MTTTHKNDDTVVLKAGASRVDITPAPGTLLAGSIGHKRPVTAIADRLWANVLTLETRDARLCIVSLDLANANPKWIDAIRQQAAAQCDLTAESIMIHTVHNHAAPTLGGNVLNNPSEYIRDDWAWMAGGDESYERPTVDRIVQAIVQAWQNRCPVKVSVGRALDERWAFNRRFIMRDGSRVTHPAPGHPDILRSEHPIDPELIVVRFDQLDSGRCVASLLHYTCHPTLGFGRQEVIGDWPGIWAQRMREHLGGEALVLNGFLGNVAPKPCLLPGYEAEYHKMAEGLFESGLQAMQNAQSIDIPALRHERCVIDLPLRCPGESDLAWAHDLLQRHPTPDWLDEQRTQCRWDWRYAVEIVDMQRTYQQRRTFAYEINVVRLGSLAMVMLMGEPFVEAQFELKLASPGDYLIGVSLCNGYVGYIPTAEAWGGNGFEVRLSNHAKLEREALATITEEAINLLKRTHD